MTYKRDVVASAIAAYAAQRSQHESVDPCDVHAGDLWVVGGSGSRPMQRVVLVLNAEGAHLDIVLTSNETDFADDRDLLLTPEDTDCPYPLIVETPLVGRIHWSQARRRVGVIADALLDDILDFIWDERPHELEARRGATLPRPVPAARLEFERHEVAELKSLTANPGGGAAAAEAVDTSAFSMPLTTQQGCALFDALADSDTLVVDGLSNWNTDPARLPGEFAEVFGRDLAERWLTDLACRTLLSSDAVTCTFQEPGHETRLVLCSAEPSAPIVRLRVGSRRDGPIGLLNKSVVFATDE